MDVRSSTQRRWLRSHVESLLTAMTGEPASPDGDGDYPLRGVTSQAWVRLHAADPWGVHVFAYAAHDVPPRLAVLREINAATMANLGLRVVLAEPGLVVVDCFVFADALTEDALESVVGRVLHLADTIGPVLTAVHGGSTFPSTTAPSST